MAANAGEQIQQAEAYKDEGNKLFGQSEHRRALGAYHKVFCYLNGLQAPPTEGTAEATPATSSTQIPKEKVEEVRKLKQSTRLNMAACYLKLEEPQKCVEACGKALELGESAKAHYRRGQAFAELRNFSGARSELERAKDLAPDDPGITAELRKVRAAFSKGNDKERRKCAKMFAEAPADPRVKEPATVESDGPRIEELPDDLEEPDRVEPPPEVKPEPSRAAVQPTARPKEQDTTKVSSSAPVVAPLSSGAPDEASKPKVDVRELTYSWHQTEEDVKIYIPFDQSDELSSGVDEDRVQIEYGEWSVLLTIRSSVSGRAPLGLRLGDFHRRIDPALCRCTVRSSRITLKLVKQVKEHWWNLLQSVPLHAA